MGWLIAAFIIFALLWMVMRYRLRMVRKPRIEPPPLRRSGFTEKPPARMAPNEVVSRPRPAKRRASSKEEATAVDYESLRQILDRDLPPRQPDFQPRPTGGFQTGGSEETPSGFRTGGAVLNAGFSTGGDENSWKSSTPSDGGSKSYSNDGGSKSSDSGSSPSSDSGSSSSGSSSE
jgi:hypothetical protein